MTSPVASSSDPRYIEMTRRFDRASDGGRDMEVAMAATVFRDLQAAGYIPEGARLADRPPGDGGDLDGTSYEARLVELITDRDSDGRLDLDLGRLREAGLLTERPDVDTLERDLTDGIRAQLSDEMIGRQDRRSELSYLGVPNPRGRRVQGYSRGMVLEGSQDRAQAGFLAEVPGRAGQGDEEAGRVAREAIAGAQLLERRGDSRHAQTLLVDTGAALAAAGRRDAAAQVYRELQRSPYGEARVNLVQGHIDDTRRADEDYSTGDDIRLVSGGTSNTIDVSDFSSTYGELAGHRLRQIETHDRMEAALGRPVDPTDMDDARAYFDAFADGRSTEEVSEELERYFESFYVHTGHGVEWSAAVPEDERPGRMNELIPHQPRDGAGRALMDCEGYTYMTEHLLEGIRTEDGEQRFDVVYASRPGHVIAGAFDRTSGQAFEVNNDQAEMLQGDLSTPEGRANALAGAISGGYYNVVAFGRTPSAGTATQTEDGTPALGALVYDGSRILGTVTPEMQASYSEWRSQRLGGSISTYIAHVLSQDGG